MNNLVQLAGTLAEAPQLRQLTDGKYLLENRIRMYATTNSKWKKDSSLQYIPIRAFGSIAQEIEKHFSRDSQIMIRGELRHQMITDGDKRYPMMVVQVFEFVALGKPADKFQGPWRSHTTI